MSSAPVIAKADTSKTLTIAPTSQPLLTEANLVGLWSGNVRVPNHTEVWQFLPKLIYYRKNGTSATVYLHDTVLFQEDKTFLVTIEGFTSTTTTLQYHGRYSVKDTTLTMVFDDNATDALTPSNGSFLYTLSRWNNDLQLNDPKQVGFQTLLSPLSQNWQPRKGSLVYQGPSGPMQLEMDGQLNQSYHYEENGITHFADVQAKWQLVRPGGSHGSPQIQLEGVRDRADFETIAVPLQAIPGIDKEIEQIKHSPAVLGYFYSLKLLEVADIKPKQYVWELVFDWQSGWELDAAIVPPSTLYPSLTSPDLKKLISRLPRGTSLTFTPTGHGFGSTDTAVKPDDPEYGLKDFAVFCRSKGVQFHLNYNRF